MLRMQSRRGAVVLHPQPQFPAFAIGQADDGLDQIGIGKPFAVAFELNGVNQL